jgi:hypothetical protein
MDPKRLTDHRIKDWEVAQILVLNGSERSIAIREVSDLLLIELFPDHINVIFMSIVNVMKPTKLQTRRLGESQGVVESKSSSQNLCADRP